MFTTATKFLQPVTSIMIAIQAEEMPCRQRRCNAGKSKCNAGNVNAMQAKSNTMQAKVNAMQAKVYAKQAKMNTMQELGKQGVSARQQHLVPVVAGGPRGHGFQRLPGTTL